METRRISWKQPFQLARNFPRIFTRSSKELNRKSHSNVTVGSVFGMKLTSTNGQLYFLVERITSYSYQIHRLFAFFFFLPRFCTEIPLSRFISPSATVPSVLFPPTAFFRGTAASNYSAIYHFSRPEFKTLLAGHLLLNSIAWLKIQWTGVEKKSRRYRSLHGSGSRQRQITNRFSKYRGEIAEWCHFEAVVSCYGKLVWKIRRIDEGRFF